MRRLGWLRPGLGVKRWAVLIGLGLILIALGSSQVLTVRRLSSVMRQLGPTDISLLSVGFLLILLGLGYLVDSLARSLAPEHLGQIPDVLYQNRVRLRGPRIVVIGGGTGLSVLLKGLKAYTTNLTAIVTVADDGGSSGRLRRDMAVLPPGDIRNCLVALARREDLLSRLFQYRFDKGADLAGHSFGNLLIAAMTEITGDFLAAIKVSSEVLAIVGEVLPSTCANVTLRATFTDGTRLQGESAISRAGKRIRHIELVPSGVEPPAPVTERLAAAECIVLGPGSLYTSVIPNLLVPAIARAVNASCAPIVFVANIMTQPGETDRFTLSDHIQALIDHSGLRGLDVTMVNQAPIQAARLASYAAVGAEPVGIDTAGCERLGVTPRPVDLLAETDLIRHDPHKLAAGVMSVIEDRLASRVRILRARRR